MAKKQVTSTPKQSTETPSKASAKTTKAIPQITETGIDLAGCVLVNVVDEKNKKTRAAAVRDGFEAAALSALKQAIAAPSGLGLTKPMQEEAKEAMVSLEEAMLLSQAEAWLTKQLALVKETKRLHLSRVTPTTKKLLPRAKLLADESPEDATEYVELIEYFAKPAQLAANTKRRNKATKAEAPS
ncbi:hypothetical protein L6R29_13100 [Myxococcota bacterium]|nr:hypothetical protein [Myxococcota bacterium]